MQRSSSHASTLLFVSCALSLGACDGASELTPDEPLAQVTVEPPLADAGASGNYKLRDPSGAVVAEVGVAGTGCRVGQIELAVSPDALTYTFTLPQLTATTTGGITTSNCVASLLPSDRTHDYGVTKLHYEGSADLGAGTRGKILLNTYNSGNIGAANNTPSFDQTGPFLGTALADRSIADADVQWSACDLRRWINVNLRVEAGRAGAASSASATSTLGGGSSKLVVQLGTRPCQARDGGAPPPVGKS